MGMSADEMMELKENDQSALEKVFDDANCKMIIFKCRGKTENFQEQARVRYQVNSASAVNYGVDALKLAEMIKAYNID
ncbi:9ca8db5a-4403-45a5-9675-6e0230d82234 [Sclerotinia trifoliorum]|uniref:9ca8db5a-4403-45a5-9675-6e0230d82234 n=1 Tax=Sclerotinia trifoliorum TaxID=28548 RepID=A0A8H2ZKU7_9HELO|nr:9ca8db5a-4403-45a5-9675-6e0230d82234 [Sclerotinia trifoliorum]